MRFVVTGSTGFTGSHVVPLLVEEGWHIRCLVRASSDISRLPLDQIEIVRGDLDDPSSLVRAFQGMDGLINIASLGFGHCPKVVGTAETAGVRRGIFISTTAIFTSLSAPSKAIRLEAEETIQKSRLEWTILRPTMIYGSPRDRNMSRLIHFLQRSPVIPVFGKGEHRQQPVYVDDLASVIMAAVRSRTGIAKCYNISGANSLTYNEVVDTVCQLLKRRVVKCHLPARPIATILRCLERCLLPLPITAEQILRLNEDKAFDHQEASRDFEYRPRTFSEGIALELRKMGLKVTG